MIWLAIAYEVLVMAWIGMTRGTDAILTNWEKLAVLAPFLLASGWAVVDLVRSLRRMRKDK